MTKKNTLTLTLTLTRRWKTISMLFLLISSRHPSLLTIEEGCSNAEKKPSPDDTSDSPELLAPAEETCIVVRDGRRYRCCS